VASTAAAPLSLCCRRILVNHRRLLYTVTLRSIFATYDAGTCTFSASGLLLLTHELCLGPCSCTSFRLMLRQRVKVVCNALHRTLPDLEW
jgi:hypothetical protein